MSYKATSKSPYIGKGQAGNPVLVASDINIAGASSVTLDCFTDDFIWYEIYFYELQSDSTTSDTYLRWNLRAGGSDLTSSSYHQAWRWLGMTGSGDNSANYSSTTTLQLGPPGRLDNDNGSAFTGISQIDARTTNLVIFYIDYIHNEAGSGGNWHGTGAIHYDNSGTKIDGFKVYLTTSSSPNEDFDGGAIYVYGYR